MRETIPNWWKESSSDLGKIGELPIGPGQRERAIDKAFPPVQQCLEVDDIVARLTKGAPTAVVKPSEQAVLFCSKQVLNAVERCLGRAAQSYFVESIYHFLPEHLPVSVPKPAAAKEVA